MTYYTSFKVRDGVSIRSINTRLAELDEAIGDANADAGGSLGALLTDVKATTVDGGSASAASWNTRTLNAEIDVNAIVTLSSNQFTPIAGTYIIYVVAPAKDVDLHKLRLYNVTQASTVIVGVIANAVNGDGLASVATLMHIFTADGADAYRIDHYTTTAQASDGLGEAQGDGLDEVYTQVLLIKI